MFQHVLDVFDAALLPAFVFSPHLVVDCGIAHYRSINQYVCIAWLPWLGSAVTLVRDEDW